MPIRILIANYLPWLLSTITIYATWLAGDKSIRSWQIKLGGQVLWLAWVWASASWGLLPMNGVLTVLYVRAYMKWKEDERSSSRNARVQVGDQSRDPLLEIHSSGLYGLA